MGTIEFSVPVQVITFYAKFNPSSFEKQTSFNIKGYDEKQKFVFENKVSKVSEIGQFKQYTFDKNYTISSLTFSPYLIIDNIVVYIDRKNIVEIIQLYKIEEDSQSSIEVQQMVSSLEQDSQVVTQQKSKVDSKEKNEVEQSQKPRKTRLSKEERKRQQQGLIKQLNETQPRYLKKNLVKEQKLQKYLDEEKINQDLKNVYSKLDKGLQEVVEEIMKNHKEDNERLQNLNKNHQQNAKDMSDSNKNNQKQKAQSQSKSSKTQQEQEVSQTNNKSKQYPSRQEIKIEEKQSIQAERKDRRSIFKIFDQIIKDLKVKFSFIEETFESIDSNHVYSLIEDLYQMSIALLQENKITKAVSQQEFVEFELKLISEIINDTFLSKNELWNKFTLKKQQQNEMPVIDAIGKRNSYTPLYLKEKFLETFTKDAQLYVAQYIVEIYFQYISIHIEPDVTSNLPKEKVLANLSNILQQNIQNQQLRQFLNAFSPYIVSQAVQIQAKGVSENQVYRFYKFIVSQSSQNHYELDLKSILQGGSIDYQLKSMSYAKTLLEDFNQLNNEDFGKTVLSQEDRRRATQKLKTYILKTTKSDLQYYKRLSKIEGIQNYEQLADLTFEFLSQLEISFYNNDLLGKMFSDLISDISLIDIIHFSDQESYLAPTEMIEFIRSEIESKIKPKSEL